MFYPYMTRKQLKRLMRRGNFIAIQEWVTRFAFTSKEHQSYNLWCA